MATSDSDVMLDRLLEHIPIGVVSVDARGTVLSCNREAAAIIERPSDELLGAALTEAFPPAAREQLRDMISGSSASGMPCSPERVERVAADGTARTIEVTVAPVTGPGGQPATIVLLQDVTRRIEQEAQEALQARNEFLSSVSHDLTTPIATIKGMAQLLQRRAARAGAPDMERFVEGLSSIDAATTKMANLIRELIDVTHLQTGQPLELDRQPVDLVALAHRVAAEHQQHTDRHRIRVEAADGEVAGEWDPLRLERVIGNLLSNAIKYSPDGGDITVAIGLEETDGGPPVAGAPDRWANLSVTDQGIGIPAADLPHIFERFRRARNAGRRIEGTGIGLAGARRIVEQHGGAIEVESHEGQGSTFTVRLPMQ